MAKKSKVQYDFTTIDKIYRWFPFFFLVFSSLNIWFIYSYVNREKVDLTNIKSSVYADVSNVWAFVSTSLSNEIFRVKAFNSVQMRPIYIPSTNDLTNVSTNSVSDSSIVGFFPPSDVPAHYFTSHGVPYIRFDDRSIYGVGDNFGYGEIKEIYRLGIVCENRYYRLLQPSSSDPHISSPSFPPSQNRPLPPVYNFNESEVVQNGVP